ncbi:hypothetical protein B0F90DRAFT_1817813 [Multifurca ochricompacta]|uniref:Uncharacterized protein n=1 Tax=Multifurca ochricompacta TaxID=376703 RepID=A0AAD4M3F0_9AGAM|nr:hypothetical protein B0F90DRAFT_1817813 [Multifurca ochricompacta]
MAKAKAKDRRGNQLSTIKTEIVLRRPIYFTVFKSSPIWIPITVQQWLEPDATLPEILWNFSHYGDVGRITLEQNPHFYSMFPGSVDGMFTASPIQDFRSLPDGKTIYVIVDKPGRVFLETEQRTRIFGNIWAAGSVMIFKGSHYASFSLYIFADGLPDVCGRLEGENVVGESIRGSSKFWYCKQPVQPFSLHTRVNRSSRGLRPILTPPLVKPAPGRIIKNWRAPIRKTTNSNNINVHICTIRATAKLILPPSPPTSERPGYSVLYTTVHRLNDDILLSIFDSYRLEDEDNWNRRSGWCKLSHKRIPAMAEDEGEILLALQQHGRIRRVVLQAPSPSLHRLLEDTNLILPRTFLAPNLHHLSLIGVAPPTGLPMLASAVTLVTLILTRIRASGYFPPAHLVTQLRFCPQLEELSIGFSVPYPVPVPRGNCCLESIPLFSGDSISHFLINSLLLSQTYPSLPERQNVIGYREELGDEPFSLRVSCKQFDWQLDSAAQVCGALSPVLSAVEELRLDFDEHTTPSDWENAVDNVVWHELLLPFSGVKRLSVGHALSLELSHALRLDAAGLVLELLPRLQELELELEKEHAQEAFAAFIVVRQLAGRPVHLTSSLEPRAPSTQLSQLMQIESPLASGPPSAQRSWIRRAVVNPVSRLAGYSG